eukprot:Stramenopile-MAST_4_protein_824
MKIEPYCPFLLDLTPLPTPVAARSCESSAGEKRSEPSQHGGADKRFCVMLGGGGWYGNFFLGTVKFLMEHFPREFLDDKFCFAGESSGAALASYATYGEERLRMSIDDIIYQHRLVCDEAYNRLDRGFFGLQKLGQKAYYACLERLTDADVAACADRLLMTTNVLMSECALKMRCHTITDIQSVAELKYAVNCSAYIPFLMPGGDKWPRIDGMRTIDGGFSAAGSVPCFDNTVPIYLLACGAPLENSIPPIFAKPAFTPADPDPYYMINMVPAPSLAAFDAMVTDGYNRAKEYFSGDYWKRQVAAWLDSRGTTASPRKIVLGEKMLQEKHCKRPKKRAKTPVRTTRRKRRR